MWSLRDERSSQGFMLTKMIAAFVWFAFWMKSSPTSATTWLMRSEEHTSELQSRFDLVCRLLLEKKKKKKKHKNSINKNINTIDKSDKRLSNVQSINFICICLRL